MMKRYIGLVLAALLPWLLASCMRGEVAKGHAVYQVKGVVREVMAEKKSVTIDHEKIPGYMEAMTMDFSVTNAAELAGLRSGDVITFRMTVTTNDGWIDQIRKTGATNAIALPPEPFR